MTCLGGMRLGRLRQRAFDGNMVIAYLAYPIGGVTVVPTVCQTALKEWAVVARALGRGEQALLLRKGGIREEGKRFQVTEDEFFIYPTYEHQREDLLQDRYRGELKEVLNEPRDPAAITFTLWAKVEDVLDVSDQGALDSLTQFSVWAPDYCQKRLSWKPRQPLSAIILKVYVIEEPVTVPYLDEYGGCKSWVRLDQPVPLGRATPVLTGQVAADTAGRIRRVLESPLAEARRG